MTQIDEMFDAVEFRDVPPPQDNREGLPYPVKHGFMTIGGCQLECYVLNTGERIFTEESIIRFFGGLPDDH